jgi:hypothetical protein
MKRQTVNQALQELLHMGFVVSYSRKCKSWRATHPDVDHRSIVSIIPQGWSSTVAKISVSWPDCEPVEAGNIPTAIRLALKAVEK